jgi:hypothetical protein
MASFGGAFWAGLALLLAAGAGPPLRAQATSDPAAT